MQALIELTTHTMHEILACAKFNIGVARIKIWMRNTGIIYYLRMLNEEYSVLSMVFSLLNSQQSILDLGLPILDNHSFLSTEIQHSIQEHTHYNNNYMEIGCRLVLYTY